MILYNIIEITLKKNIKDIYLLFWSICLPLGTIISLFCFEIEVSKNKLLAILTVGIFFYCCTTSSFSILAQRKRGVFDLIKITSFSLWKYLISVTISQTLIAVVISEILLLFENYLFSYELSGLQFIFFIPVFFLAASIFTLIGFCLSSFPSNEGQLSITTNLVMIPLIIFSSIFLNLNSESNWIFWLSWINPVEWIQKSYVAILSSTASQYMISFLALLIFFGLFLYFSKKSFQKDEN